MRAMLLLAFTATLAGCAGAPQTVRLTGVETRTATDAPRIVPAGFVLHRDGTQMELVTADGTPLSGLLQRVEQPVIVPLATTGVPLVGGGTELVGDINGSGLVMNCRFSLLNPPRGLDGGGSGRCTGSGRQVDFLF